MRLSEAIRLGSMIRPQAFNSTFERGRSCAAGAAMEAVGIKDPMMEKFPAEWLGEPVHGCPVRRRRNRPECLGATHTHHLDEVIVHLNDHHHWTRERIAEWVESIEAKHVETTQTEHVDLGTRAAV